MSEGEKKPRAKSEKTLAQQVARQFVILRRTIEAAREKGVNVAVSVDEATNLPWAKVTVGYTIEA